MKKNGSGFKLDDGEWYGVRPAEIARLMGADYGDNVSLNYSIVTKNGQDYRNIEGSVEVLQKSSSPPPQFNSNRGGARPADNTIAALSTTSLSSAATKLSSGRLALKLPANCAPLMEARQLLRM
jgi:hypothetical protein